MIQRIQFFLFFLMNIFLRCSIAQNLVPNPSFETYTLCPMVQGKIEYTAPWTAAKDTSSTDYFNSCAPFGSTGSSPGYGIPKNDPGFQQARTGSAYAGLIMFSSFQREYIQVQLIYPLIAGKSYYTEFYVNLSNGPGTIYIPSCNSIAANFSVTKPVHVGWGRLALTEHILAPGNPVLKDTLNWLKVSGIYTAQGGEEYITIGVFAPQNAVQVLDPLPLYSYYLLDDVSVQDVTGIESFQLENDLKIFPNPATEIVTVFSEIILSKVKIVDLMGNEVLSMFTNSKSIEISIKDFANGIYFVNVYQNDRIVKREKIVLNK